jgi:hypothetical protein
MFRVQRSKSSILALASLTTACQGLTYHNPTGERFLRTSLGANICAVDASLARDRRREKGDRRQEIEDRR